MSRATAPLLLPAALIALLAGCNVPMAVTVGGSDAATGTPQCQFSAGRELALDLQGVSKLALELGPDTLVLTGQPGMDIGRIEGRACASSEAGLQALQLQTQREGDTLVVRATRPEHKGISLGSRYAWLDLRGQLPDSLPVTLRLGSGDVEASKLASLQAVVGAGDVLVQDIAGAVQLTLGSGDVDIQRAGSLDVPNLGSGDLKAGQIGAGVRIGNIGSGNVQLNAITGDVQVQAIGSGDLELAQIQGNVRVGAVGSGDLQVRHIQGNLEVGRIGSGTVDHDQVSGKVSLPSDH